MASLLSAAGERCWDISHDSDNVSRTPDCEACFIVSKRTQPATMPPMSEEKSTSKSWQARIGEATDKLAASFVESISYDRRIYKQDIAGSIAHATMLAKVGLINDGERDQIIEGLKTIERDIEGGNFVFDESLEDIHMVIEA